MFLILSTMLLTTLFGSMIYKGKVTAQRAEEERLAELQRIEDERQAKIAAGPDTFKRAVKDDMGVPAEVMKVITDYLDLYFRSMYRLELQDDSNLFSREYYSTLSKYANQLIVESRKLYDFDFRMHDAAYELEVTDYSNEDGFYYVTVLEHDYFDFNFLDDNDPTLDAGITSSAYNIESVFKIEQVNGAYKINSLYKEQGFFIMFYDETNGVEDFPDLYNYYLGKMSDLIKFEKEQKQLALTNGYTSTKTFNTAYNRNAAAEYAYAYCYNRNPEWYCFDDTGGNCQNFASQAILAGGIPMDYQGDYQWKHFGEGPDIELEINEAPEPSGRSQSWVNVNFFAEYAQSNIGYGMVAEIVPNIGFMEPGDIIQVSYDSPSEMAHTTIVTKVVDGHPLVCSNTLDLRDFPVEAYTYPYRRFIKILGSNQ